MLRVHMHTPGWVHRHKPDWHTMGIRLDHLVHDPRFWAALALAILLGAMIAATILTKSIGGTPVVPTYPLYPFMP
ncbi:MAG: hypothetical protein H8E62_02590 [Planctomycetes bacterium]|nr:hypothetical protein [Planctomycetota bacterium]